MNLCLRQIRPVAKCAHDRPTANEQLRRTVIRRRERGASASFHCALAPRWLAQRAAADACTLGVNPSGGLRMGQVRVESFCCLT